MLDSFYQKFARASTILCKTQRDKGFLKYVVIVELLSISALAAPPTRRSKLGITNEV